MRSLKRTAIAVLLYGLLCVALVVGSDRFTARCTAVVQPADIAVVLGGGSMPEQLTPVTLERTMTGIALYERGVVQHLHMTGGGDFPGRTPGELMAELAIAAGVPPDRVSHEGASRSTLQNALFSRDALSRDTTRLLVTDPYHTWRGAFSFALAGRPASVCATADSMQSRRARLRETAAWAVNIPRGLIMGLGVATSTAHLIPDAILR